MNNFSGLFLDSGNTEQVQKWNFLIGGVTTNQVILFTKDKVTNISARIQEICKVIGNDKSLSIELPDSSWPEKTLLDFGSKIYKINKESIVVKVPILTNSEKGLKLIYNFAKKGIRTNATVGMNFGQLIMAAEAGRPYTNPTKPNYISLFWARTIESKEKYSETIDPSELLKSVKQYLIDHSLQTKIIVGSVRSVNQVREAFSSGADIVTIGPELMVELLKNKRATETIAEFDNAFRTVEKDVKLI